MKTGLIDPCHWNRCNNWSFPYNALKIRELKSPMSFICNMNEPATLNINFYKVKINS